MPMKSAESSETKTPEYRSPGSPGALEIAWQKLREETPRLRIRDAAERLGVAEAELVAVDCGETVIRLRAD